MDFTFPYIFVSGNADGSLLFKPQTSLAPKGTVTGSEQKVGHREAPLMDVSMVL